MDIDDIVDEVLTALKTNGWSLDKMQYELCKLTASCKETREHEGAGVDITFVLSALWRDMGDMIELEILVEEPTQSWTQKECITKCSAVLGSLKEEKTYQSLYVNTGVTFDEELDDEFESYN